MSSRAASRLAVNARHLAVALCVLLGTDGSSAQGELAGDAPRAFIGATIIDGIGRRHDPRGVEFVGNRVR